MTRCHIRAEGGPPVLTPVCRLSPDMLRRRHVPALEEFCLVVCHVCSQVVTPQGILAHYGKAPRPAASWELAETSTPPQDLSD